MISLFVATSSSEASLFSDEGASEAAPGGGVANRTLGEDLLIDKRNKYNRPKKGVDLFGIAHLPVRIVIVIMAHTCTFHEIHTQGEESAVALESAPNVCHLQMSGQLFDRELLIVHQVAYVEIPGVHMQVSSRLHGVGGDADRPLVINEYLHGALDRCANGLGQPSQAFADSGTDVKGHELRFCGAVADYFGEAVFPVNGVAA
jgi:hypothetical protein